MDYVALVNSSFWSEMWADENVAKKLAEIRNQLLTTAVVDPHTLGKLRGQMEALQWLKTRMEAMAEQQMKLAAGELPKPDERAAQIALVRKRRII